MDNDPSIVPQNEIEPESSSEIVTEVTQVSPDQIIEAEPILIDPTVNRVLAEAMRQAGMKELWAESTGKKHTYYAFAAQMIWDLIDYGEAHFADGTVISIKENIKEWKEILKFAAQHLEGIPNQSTNIGNVNVFKVYEGIDDSKV